MDTLTLEGKEFISSKRAAEITGYAKDYIGQLCREGRVESRLIGRNWYILESSLKDHRFGGDTKAREEKNHEEEVEESFIEDTEEVSETLESRTESENEEPVEPSSESEEAVEDDSSIEEIQRAWKSWFSNRYVEENQEVSIERVVEAKPQPEIIQEREAIAGAEPIHIARLPQKAEEPIVKRLVEPQQPVRRGHRFVEPSTARAAIIHERIVTQPRKPRSRAGTLVLEALSIAVAGLSLAVAIIGAGALDTLPITNVVQEHAMRYIGGVTEY